MTASPDPRLDEMRREIESLDREMLELVKRRTDIAFEIGRVKRKAREPLRDFRLEERVKERLREYARDLGVDPKLGEDLALFLIRKAVAVQSPIVDSAYGGNRRSVLVVGGQGGMGRWISRFLNIQGHRVRIHDPAEGESRFPRVASLAEGAAGADLVVVAVPMSACAGVLRSVAACEPGGLVTEICSLKSHLRPVLDELRSAGVRVVSFHPMFGPETRLLSGKQILVCRDGHDEDERAVRELFEGTSARVVDVPFDEHDRRVAVVLGMAHLLNLGFAEALAHFGVPFEELVEVASVTFLKQIVTTREVVDENPALYYEIQKMNPSTEAVLASLIHAFERMKRAVERDDESEFARRMREQRAYFGEVPTPERGELWEAGA